MTPASAFIFFVRKASTGVGAIPMLITLVPHDKSPETRAFSKIAPVVLVSRAIKTVLAFERVAMAKPTRFARIGVTSTLARPRTPELPNSLGKFTASLRSSYLLIKAYDLKN